MREVYTKKGQASLFVIVAIVIIVAFVVVISLNGDKVEEVNKVENGVLSNVDRDAMEGYIEDKLTMLVEAAIVSGEIEDEADLRAYLDENEKILKVLNLDQFAERGHVFETEDEAMSYSVDISSNREFIILDVTYPMTIEMGDSVTNFKNFRVKVPFKRYKEIPVDDSGVVETDTYFHAYNGLVEVYLPEGTLATLDGEPIGEITIEAERVDNGNVVYDLGPDGAVFEPPIVFSVSWEDMIFEDGFTYADMGIGQWYEENDYQLPDVPKLTNMNIARFETPGAFMVPTAIVNGKRIPLVYHDTEKKLTSIPVKHFSEFKYGELKSADGTIIEPSVAIEGVEEELKCLG